MSAVDLLTEQPEAILGELAAKMEKTPQDHRWHGEGDVLTHTRLVCDELKRSTAFRDADDTTRLALYLAAVFHDTGKIYATREEDNGEGGALTSRGHARIGAGIARGILWQKYGLCGTPDKLRLRETVCTLIRYHSLPLHAVDEADGRLRLIRASSDGELIPAFTIRLLCAFAEADVRGRICSDQAESLERVALCLELADESSCVDAPYPFPNAHTAYAYMSGRGVPPDYPLYDDTWGEVILMSGLPGVGKDTWIRTFRPELPVISLDDIRRELDISPTDNQGAVISAATDRARRLLREKRPFVWNATNITTQTRRRQIELFSDYGASVRIVYLETAFDENLRRNAARAKAVPEHVIFSLADKLIPPERHESPHVDWICV